MGIVITTHSIEEQTLFQEGQTFLIKEAEMLDSGLYNEWLALLTGDVFYKIPIRITRERHAPSQFSSRSWHMNEDLGSLKMRVARTYTDYNWAEDPPSRIRHFLTNFRLGEIIEKEDCIEVEIKSNMLLYRSKFDSPAHDLLSGERSDLLRKKGGEWKLAGRTILLDHTTMGINSLGFFL